MISENLFLIVLLLYQEIPRFAGNDKFGEGQNVRTGALQVDDRIKYQFVMQSANSSPLAI